METNTRIGMIAGAIFLIVVAIVTFIGCSRSEARKADTARFCIESGGTWIYNSCVMPRQ